ncbi:N-formylglutamate amidohydrolase [Roseomonas chloroacetimidivorans]|uniref:N-formylglutamate amidohydrolase n=1 Tax=Roseomonas chloroacetimidivorans TaxID=1766656 RepID=UPI003C7270B3
MHSFTPCFQGVDRPWHAGVLFGEAKDFGRALAADIGAETDLVVGENEPYRIEPGVHDYTVPVHGDLRGLDAVLIEVRQDLLGDPAAIEACALRLASALGRAAGRFPGR